MILLGSVFVDACKPHGILAHLLRTKSLPPAIPPELTYTRYAALASPTLCVKACEFALDAPIRRSGLERGAATTGLTCGKISTKMKWIRVSYVDSVFYRVCRL